MIGERVRHLRNYYGWSQTELAEMAGVSQPAISQIERSEQVSDATLLAIARATHFPVDYFYRGPLPDMPVGSLRFRKRATSTTKNDERVRAHVRQATELIRSYESEVQLPPIRFEALPMRTPVDAQVLQSLVRDVREILGVGPEDPIPHLVRAIERSGVIVIGSVHEIEKHDGASFWPSYPDGRPVICCSRGVPGDRQRFSNAHEFGHLILHQLRQVSSQQAEEEANRFAGSLLIPDSVARRELISPVTLRGLAFIKARFGISIAALIRRGLDLGVIDENRRLSLEKQLSSRGWRRKEPVEVKEEEPLLIRRFVETATGASGAHKIAAAIGYAPLITRELVA